MRGKSNEAARSIETNDGHMLLLWCRRKSEEIEEGIDFGDDEEDNDIP